MTRTSTSTQRRHQWIPSPTHGPFFQTAIAAEVPVSAVYERLGLEQANVSQHLAVLRSKHVVVARKDGNQVFYSLRDPVIGQVLDLLRQYFHAHLEESLDLLKDMRTDQRRHVKLSPGERKP
jgi:ArsR family transcriptional regulator